MNQQELYVIELERILDLFLTHLSRINEYDFSSKQQESIVKIMESFEADLDKINI